MSPENVSEIAVYFLFRSAIAEIKGSEARLLGDDIGNLNLMTDLSFDSLDVINFLFMIEQRTGVTIPAADIDGKNLLILGNLATYLEEKAES